MDVVQTELKGIECGTVSGQGGAGARHWSGEPPISQPYGELGQHPAIEAVRPTNLHPATRLVTERCSKIDILEIIARMSRHMPVNVESVDEGVCVVAD